MHSTAGKPSVQQLPPTPWLFYVLCHVSGTFGYSLESWRRVTSTKHALVLRKVLIVKNAVYANVLCSVTERITWLIEVLICGPDKGALYTYVYII